MLASFTACFAVMLPRVEFPKFGFMAAWVPAFTLLPLVLAAPWFYSWLSRWIDRAWLGRRFSPAEAAEHFLRSTQEATTEPELLETAEASLARIFRSRACIDLDDRALPLPGALTAGFRVGDSAAGRMAILPRADEIPFLSEDTRLLTTLASSFAALLENQRLRDEKSAHVERERQLELNAARSELKALRAQINPHFLFNALGAIAGLIPNNPAQAEETVEQLAEVFRYALRRSDREWVTLAEEFDFVRAHLYVEQARFGERLRVRIGVEDEVKDVRVPAMVVQTLAENAVKHGVASVRGAGWVEVSARRQGAEVVVTVEDNGPGFPQPRPGCLPESKSGGFGLKNVQERLRAYYGEAARLELGRDEAKAATVVAIRLPANLSAAAAAQESGRTLWFAY